MADPSSRQFRAAVLILLVVLASGFFVLVKRGRAAEDGLVITGRSDPPPATEPQQTQANKPAPAPNPAPTQSQAPSSTPSGDPALKHAEAPMDVVVHVAGAVRKPGVYHLPSGARADDAVKEAGGPKEAANLDAINLAAKLEDGQQLYVPTRKEQSEGGAPISTSAVPATIPAAKSAHSSVVKPAHPKSSSHGDKLTAPGQGTVNINTAGAEELQRLPGVGPAMAARILEFRKENGPFTSAEQLMDVSGIGEKKFAKLQPFVRVR